MTVRQSILLRGISVPIAESVYLAEGTEVDTTIKGRRYLRAGFQETNTSLFDTSIFTGGVAGSLTASEKGACKRYVRIS